MSDSIRARKLLEASEAGSINLINEMKKIKGGKKENLDLPETVEDASGEASIVDKFREVYQTLYNSWDTSEEMKEIKAELFDKISKASVAEANKVTGRVVKAAACTMKAGKSDVSESYTSDCILNAPDIFFDLIAQVFRSWIVHGSVTLSLLACAFLPLVKGRKDPAKTSSYRAIAGSSLLLKLFDKTVLAIWGHLLSSDSLQFGYKVGTSTTHCSWMVMEVAGHFLRRGTPCLVTWLDCSKAFDMCKFSTLFQKLRTAGVPPIVIRVLAFVYEEQFAWVKWGQARSKQFRIVNGTRQGSVLSPSLWALYMDELLVRLRKLGVGCYIGGVYYGAVIFADDVALLAPCRSAMQQMLSVCEQYAKEHNLVFSSDPDPSKSKTKCTYMVGKNSTEGVVYPKPVHLNGVDLPWVITASHLGHEMHQSASMEHHAKISRMKFITESTDVREMFRFGMPQQVISALRLYTTSFYGSMLFDLYGVEAQKIFRSWNTAVKLAWQVPRTTHSYLVENLLGKDSPSLRTAILSRFVKYFHGLTKCAGMETRSLAGLSQADARSTLGKNLRKITIETGKDPRWTAHASFRDSFKTIPVPDEDSWRIPLLSRLLDERREKETMEEDTKSVEELIASLCSS